MLAGHTDLPGGGRVQFPDLQVVGGVFQQKLRQDADAQPLLHHGHDGVVILGRIGDPRRVLGFAEELPGVVVQGVQPENVGGLLQLLYGDPLTGWGLVRGEDG